MSLSTATCRQRSFGNFHVHGTTANAVVNQVKRWTEGYYRIKKMWLLSILFLFTAVDSAEVCVTQKPQGLAFALLFVALRTDLDLRRRGTMLQVATPLTRLQICPEAYIEAFRLDATPEGHLCIHVHVYHHGVFKGSTVTTPLKIIQLLHAVDSAQCQRRTALVFSRRTQSPEPLIRLFTKDTVRKTRFDPRSKAFVPSTLK